jgi:hypothetical protein
LLTRSRILSLSALFFLVSQLSAQVLTAAEIKDPVLRSLQETYFKQLQDVGEKVHAHIFPFPFYFSRVLDLERPQQERADQRSLRFDTVKEMTVVEITGNYFGSYPSDSMDKSQRALRTFTDVALPILRIAVPIFSSTPEVEGFALEISHRVRGRALGVNMEHPENFVVILPRAAAVKLITAKTENDRQAAILEGQTYINAEPFVLYLSDEAAETFRGTPEQERAAQTIDPRTGRTQSSAAITRRAAPTAPPEPPPAPPRDLSPDALATIQTDLKITTDRVLKDLDHDAHFVSYAPPTVIPFRKGAYLQFSMNSTLATTASSRYKLAALAFDEHIARLLRPLMGYFKADHDLDGISFSTSIHADTPSSAAKAASAADTGSQGVEFFFPLASLRCYESYDCTGQQLINAGAVLINGERVSLDLQTAEADSH